MLNKSRHIHRSLVPIAAIPLVLTAMSGVIFSVLDQRDIKAEWLLDVYTGHYGPINLEPYYAYLLGLCVLILVSTGAVMWWRTNRRLVHQRHHEHQ